MPTTPNMGLILPTVSVTFGPTYASDNNTAFTTIDVHNHTSGKGIPVPSDGLNINADLTFGGYNATVLRTTRYDAQGSALAEVTDIGCLYVAGVDLYYNDGNGVQIQLTAGGALNAASIGGIGGDYSTSDASVFYTDSTKTFTFWQDTNKSALMDIGTILLRRVDNTSSAAITIKPSTSLSVGYTLTLPISLPAATGPVMLDSSGNFSFLAAPSSTEIGYVTGVTSAIQTQLNARITSSATTLFTASGTWTKATLDPKFVKVTVIGGGGGGGGTGATSGSESATAAGGGAGGTSIKLILAASLGATETVTVGTGGAGGSAGNNSGSSGNTSSFGVHASSTGGAGGAGSAGTSGTANSASGTGGIGSSGDLNLRGSAGFNGRVISGVQIGLAFGGSGYLGTGGKGEVNGAGNAGNVYGGGGSGASSGNSTSARAGGAGAAGIVIVEEFY